MMASLVQGSYYADEATQTVSSNLVADDDDVELASRSWIGVSQGSAYTLHEVFGGSGSAMGWDFPCHGVD